jgi:hypothetical protein
MARTDPDRPEIVVSGWLSTQTDERPDGLFALQNGHMLSLLL